MTNIIVLSNDEKFITYLDPDLVDITETFENGLRSIKVTYNVNDIVDAKIYFKIGNKLFITGRKKILEDCLYVIDTPVKRDIYKENNFEFEAEEVLVELNFAPYFSQTELTANNGFSLYTVNGEQSVKVNYNALKYWFGYYFNIGVVQDCISDYVSKVVVSGTMSLMTLLRYIEEETGNVFVTRYEKDILDNTIHRYLDFLNPVSQNKNWECNFEYDFQDNESLPEYDEDDQPTEEDPDEDVYEEDDIVEFADIETIRNLNPETLQFRFTDKNGNIIHDNSLPSQDIVWDAYNCGLTEESKNVIIRMVYRSGQLGVKVHNKTYTVYDTNDAGVIEHSYVTIDNDPTNNYNCTVPSPAYFEFYDTASKRVIFRRLISPILNEVHEDILDLGYNVENISFETDETETYTAISPVLSVSQDSTSLSRTDLNKVITAWKNLAVNKGDTVPMVVQKITQNGSSLSDAKSALGTFDLSSNYWKRPIKPTDNTDSETKSYEFWRGTAYWRAPFTKNAGEMHVSLDTKNNIEYSDISYRPDMRNDKGIAKLDKIGPVETSDEDVYAIYNAVCMKLKDKKDPKFNITVDVANLKNGTFNDYNVHDKVYVKLPGSEELVTAEVVKTVKNLHNIAENKVELGNYSINTKEITKETYIDADNINFKYPKSKKLSATLKNATDDNDKLSGKLVTFTLYKIENGTSTLTKKVYSKKTDSNGIAKITCKYNPGEYEIQIRFGGDAEYSECAMNVQVSVGGTKQVKTKTTTGQKAKTTQKTKYKTVTQYYDKYGRSPDKKTIMAIGLPSRASENSKYGYRFMKSIFENKCPGCGKRTLMWGWNFGTYFRGRREGGSYEGHLFCDNPNCDMDFSTINGENHNGSGRPKVKRIKAPVKSSKAEAQKLKNGKMVYGTKKIKIKEKNNTSNKNRVVKGTVNSYVHKKALSIVGNSVGRAAMKKICAWMDAHIHYHGYNNFCRSAKTSLQRGGCNCCDGTRLFFGLCDAAGCTEYFKYEYIHVYGHVYAKVTNKQTGNYVWVDSASDVHGMWKYICIDYRGKGIIHKTEYPRLPF
ncbi:hypothetical protein [Methanobrevibacter sp.]|uniref:hypothetical protein n=1 Tax=Methanobrevibacter sp. TaxID=66852 RepID=UPI00388D08DE